MDFNKNKLIDSVLMNYYETFSNTLDTVDYVPPKYSDKIDKYIFKNMRNKFKDIEIYELLYLEENNVKIGVFNKLKIYFSGLRPLYDADKNQSKSSSEDYSVDIVS